MPLNNFDPADFLANYWQRRPLLIRNALPDVDCPVDGGDLAGLACEHDAESRLIIEDNGRWSLRNGPFSESDFGKLPARDWTLLVQAVDQWIPEVTELLEHFRFIPHWRIDDIMASYAVDGGSVGPHFDHYDVFLIQGSGRRRWQLGQHCDERTALRSDSDLHLLADFEAGEEWLLEPGDILYLPPQLAHWGTAVGDDCITLSVGFRAPSQAELLGHWCDEVASTLPESRRYTDPLAADPAAVLRANGEISAESLAEVRRLLLEALDKPAQLADWFGRLMTEPKYPDLVAGGLDIDAAELQQRLAAGELLQLSLSARTAISETAGRPQLFADGHSFELDGDSLALGRAVAAALPGTPLDGAMFQNGASALCLALQLYETGTLHFADDEDY